MRKHNQYSMALDYHENTKTLVKPQSFDPKIAYKIYPSAKAIVLEKNHHMNVMPNVDRFLRTLLARKSTREFSHQGIRFGDLSQLVTLSCGLRGKDDNYDFRTYASAGGRYPIEVYVAVLESKEIDKGVYHFNVRDNSLELIKAGDCCDKVREFYQNQCEVITTTYSCLILFSMVPNRTMDKYGERGYRFILLDAGHMSQNLYLVATYLGMGIVELGAGASSDDILDNILGLTDDESVFLGFALGYPNL